MSHELSGMFPYIPIYSHKNSYDFPMNISIFQGMSQRGPEFRPANPGLLWPPATSVVPPSLQEKTATMADPIS